MLPAPSRNDKEIVQFHNLEDGDNVSPLNMVPTDVKASGTAPEVTKQSFSGGQGIDDH